MLRRAALLLLVVLPGAATALVCGYFVLWDWASLRAAFPRLESAIAHGSHRDLAAAQALDQVYRVNCFADGVGFILALILLAIGIHGLCLLPEKPPPIKR